MFIDSIILKNYRAYKGVNKVEFRRADNNIFLIAGNNGFGKTTFLTSLVWCLYGRLMVDVDEKFRREINDSKGYKNYVKQIFNHSLANYIDSLDLSPEVRKDIQKKGYGDEYSDLYDKSQYSVEISISDILIPSIPCSNIQICRTYDYLIEQETIEVLIDGHVNELAKEVGYDIFINDFVLSKDIAKFFFFDAEKIVSLAEIKTLDEKRKLSSAYGEVLGIKKYEDIKRNLDNLRLKFRRQSGVSVTKTQLDNLTNNIQSIEETISNVEHRRSDIDERILKLRTDKDDVQEKLIREGNAISIEELSKLKALLETLKAKDITLKNRLKEMLDIAPFAIAGNLLNELKYQVDTEQKIKSDVNASAEINLALNQTHAQLLDAIKADLGFENYAHLKNLVTDVFNKNKRKDETLDDVTILLDYTKAESNEFHALYNNIKLSFSNIFKQLVKDIKNNSIFLSKTQKKISAAELDDNNIEIKSLRDTRTKIETELTELESEAREISEKMGVLNKELTTNKKRLAELSKLIRVDDVYKEKDVIAGRLIEELTNFIYKLRFKRKSSLEKRIKAGMDKLMHKTDFIHSVNIDIQEDIIEIMLLDKNGNEISKESLSKGEQQLYATAILQSLVEESGIEFPVFIDSPLQKFDRLHSHNIITKFYPTVSKQVVLFPLLGKELSQEEYSVLLPNINSTFVIDNQSGNSRILRVESSKLFALR